MVPVVRSCCRSDKTDNSFARSRGVHGRSSSDAEHLPDAIMLATTVHPKVVTLSSSPSSHAAVHVESLMRGRTPCAQRMLQRGSCMSLSNFCPRPSLASSSGLSAAAAAWAPRGRGSWCAALAGTLCGSCQLLGEVGKVLGLPIGPALLGLSDVNAVEARVVEARHLGARQVRLLGDGRCQVAQILVEDTIREDVLLDDALVVLQQAVVGGMAGHELARVGMSMP